MGLSEALLGSSLAGSHLSVSLDSDSSELALELLDSGVESSDLGLILLGVASDVDADSALGSSTGELVVEIDDLSLEVLN